MHVLIAFIHHDKAERVLLYSGLLLQPANEANAAFCTKRVYKTRDEGRRKIN